MYSLSWTPTLLEKDNSKNNPVNNTQVWVLHIIGRKGKEHVHTTEAYLALILLSPPRPQQDASSPAHIHPAQPSAGTQPTRVHTSYMYGNIMMEHYKIVSVRETKWKKYPRNCGGKGI